MRADRTPEKQLQCSPLLKYRTKGKLFFFLKANYISIGTKKRGMTFLTHNFSILSLFSVLDGITFAQD